MIRAKVQSSNVAEIGYDPATQTVEVMYHPRNGVAAVWHYSPVDEFAYNVAMAPGGSIGRFVNHLKATTTSIQQESVTVEPVDGAA